MVRVLVLGDGDFSFSSTLLSTLRHIPDFESSSFLVTSFDPYGEITGKYSESSSLLKDLSEFNNVTVRHDVDATVSMVNLLDDAGVSDFTDIVFNFPHLGLEDAKLHSRLLAHFLHHAKHVLHPCGTVYISLAVAQADRWGIGSVIRASGCVLSDTVPFDAYNSWGHTYNIKRHHNGQSFVRRVGECACYCIKR